MELSESIESLNNQLINLFGIDTITGRAIWRIVWSENEFEKRLVDTTPEGLFLLTPTIAEVPKYRQWIKEKYILERLVLVPESNTNELLGLKQSYEPIWTFQDADGKYLSPTIVACKFIIDTVYAAMGKKSLAKYKEDEKNVTEEGRQQRIKELESELFGNETDVGDALAHGQAVIVPNKEN